MKIQGLLISILLLAGTALAGSNPKQVDAGAAFARLKALAGEWEADTSHGKVQNKYEVIAGGSVLLEHINVPGEGEMVTAYHLDGDKLVLTHYCMAGNQPHMVAEKFDSPSGELNFAFAGASNLAPGAGHMHNASFHLVSDNRFDAKWDFFEAGKLKFSEDMHFNRVK